MDVTIPGGMFFSEKTMRKRPVCSCSGVGVEVPAGVRDGVRLGPAVRVVVGPGVEIGRAHV